MIRNPSKNLTLIVYNSPKSPRYLKINKKLLSSLILVPLLVISTITVSILYSMFLKNQVIELKSSEPKIIKDLKEKNKELSSQLDSTNKNNKILTQKLSLGSSSESTISSFRLFTPPLGIVDLREKDLLKIDNILLKNENNIVELHFNLANNSLNNDKLSGYITVVQFQKNSMYYYPAYELSEKNLRLEYSKGESFSFSRFRPTVARFPLINKSSVRYKIYIFSKTGDLIAYKQAGPFNID